MIDKTIDDARIIEYVCFPNEVCVDTADEYISRISAYAEDGQMAHVTWFAVYSESDKLIMRINSAFVAIVGYRED